MISLPILVWLATMALLIDYVGLTRADDGTTRAVAIGFGLLFWVAFAISATGYTVITNAGVVIQRSSQALAVIGLLGAAISVVLLLETAFNALGREL